MSTLTIKTPVFEGPLELLLELIESRKLLINDIALAAVTDDYLARIATLKDVPLDETSDFVVLAATLLLIKSRSLLPTLSLTEDETSDIKDLERRLAEYQIIRTAARALERSLKTTPALWEGVLPPQEPVFMPDVHTTIADLYEAAQRLIAEFPKAVAALPKVAVRKAISLEEVIAQLAQRVSSTVQLSFREFAGHKERSAVSQEQKYGIVVSFLALLELVKQGIIRASQADSFGDISLESDAVSTPSYE